MSNSVPENALFVCFGCLSNVGTLTGLAGLEAVKQAGIFCLGGLATEAPSVLDKTRAARRIVTVDGCPLNCARRMAVLFCWWARSYSSRARQATPPIRGGNKILATGISRPGTSHRH
ncbi:MAG: hypothetical protein JXM73_18890 [Anaerolineae bacterium]|nr:hypothetical protein [Anaerolineae bacterium]